MAAELVFHRKMCFDDGAIREMKIWKLPKPDSERPHALKYSLYYGKNGERLVAYDNERGKGDHYHHGGKEYPYQFTSVEQLLADFEQDVREWRNE